MSLKGKHITCPETTLIIKLNGGQKEIFLQFFHFPILFQFLLFTDIMSFYLVPDQTIPTLSKYVRSTLFFHYPAVLAGQSKMDEVSTVNYPYPLQYSIRYISYCLISNELYSVKTWSLIP